MENSKIEELSTGSGKGHRGGLSSEGWWVREWVEKRQPCSGHPSRQIGEFSVGVHLHPNDCVIHYE